MKRLPAATFMTCAIAIFAMSASAEDDPQAPAMPALQQTLPAPETPADVAAAPADAAKTDSGLASKILQQGKGSKHPKATDTVVVHYSGWTTDGKLFDSSVQRGEPATFGLGQVIPGWSEGLQLMVEGEKRRLWVPAELAYGEESMGGRPAGMLVFDVELIQIKDAPQVPQDTEKTESGVAFQTIKPATAKEHPGDPDLITFQAVLQTMDGNLLQDTHGAPETPSVPMKHLTPPMQEAFKDMGVGEIRRLWIPEPSAPGGHLVMELELVSYKPTPPAPEAPEDVAAAPENAEKSASGLAWKILKPAQEGAAKPKASDTVKVHYSGWTTDGQLFDSSIERDQPATFPLAQVIPGWTEGVQLMGVGEKRRFWIPASLAYGETPPPGAPVGMLVFDLELLEIVE